MTSLAKTAIVGIGTTEQGQIPGFTGEEIAVQAAVAALKDAGIDKTQLDGIVTCKPPGGPPRGGIDENICRLMGINPDFSSTLEYGGCGFSLHWAAAAIEAGIANNVLIVMGSDARSRRISMGGGRDDFVAPYGLVHIAGMASLAMRVHMAKYGTTEEQLGWVSVSQREWAVNNPRAIFRQPMTIEDYLALPYWAAPLRRPDLTMISDGGVAFVVTGADRAADFRATPVYVLAMAQASGMAHDQNPDRLERPYIRKIGQKLYGATGLSPKDIDACYFQDATSFWVLQQLEGYGFCGIGEGGPFLAEGHTRPGGDLPTNTGGSQLSESYMWNWLNLYEAVDQVRKTAGPRQLPKADVALHGQTHDFWKGAGTILSVHSGS
ncbi:MAG: thiolase family protein [Chloroflexi bacterium]|nr:thiolase family protein [Chloroflexota bacterium]